MTPEYFHRMPERTRYTKLKSFAAASVFIYWAELWESDTSLLIWGSLEKGCLIEKCCLLFSRNSFFQGYLKLKDMYPIFKALLKFCTTKNLFKSFLFQRKKRWNNHKWNGAFLLCRFHRFCMGWKHIEIFQTAHSKEQYPMMLILTKIDLLVTKQLLLD